MGVPIATIAQLVLQIMVAFPEVLKVVQEVTEGKDVITQEDIDSKYITKDPEDYRA